MYLQIPPFMRYMVRTCDLLIMWGFKCLFLCRYLNDEKNQFAQRKIYCFMSASFRSNQFLHFFLFPYLLVCIDSFLRLTRYKFWSGHCPAREPWFSLVLSRRNPTIFLLLCSSLCTCNFGLLHILTLYVVDETLYYLKEASWDFDGGSRRVEKHFKYIRVGKRNGFNSQFETTLHDSLCQCCANTYMNTWCIHTSCLCLYFNHRLGSYKMKISDS